MPPRKAHDAHHATTYNQDNIPRDEALTNMPARIDMLATQMAQMTELLAERHRTPERENKSSESFANPFFGRRHKTKYIDTEDGNLSLELKFLNSREVADQKNYWIRLMPLRKLFNIKKFLIIN